MERIFKKAYESKWLILGLVLILLLAWVAWPFMSDFIYAIFIYYMAKPIKKRIRPYIKNDTILVFACMFLMALPFILLIGYAILLMTSQFNSVVSDIGMPMSAGPLSNISSAISTIGQNDTVPGIMSGNVTSVLHDLIKNGLSGNLSYVQGLQQAVVSTGLTVVDIAFHVFLTFVMAFYLIRDDERIKAWFARLFPSMMKEYNGVFVRYYRAVDEDLEKIFFSNIISIIFFAIVAAFIFSLLNVFAPTPEFLIPYPILMGMLCGAAALVPVVGMYLVTVPLFLLILFRALAAGVLLPNMVFFIVMIATVLLFVQTIPEMVIRPFVARGQINQSLLMFAYILGPVVFGVAGLFAGAILLVLITHYFRIVLPEITKQPGASKI